MNENLSPVPDETPTPVRRPEHRVNVKPRSSCKFWSFKPEEREQIMEWLFEKNDSCRAVSERCKKQFGLPWDRSAIAIFYRKEATRRNQERIFGSAKEARKIVKALGCNSKEISVALQHVIGQIAFRAAMATEPGQKPNYRLLMDALPLLINAHKSDREEEGLKLEREQWEFDVARTCHDHIKELAEIIANEALDEPSRLQEIRRRLFGKNLAPEEQ